MKADVGFLPAVQPWSRTRGPQGSMLEPDPRPLQAQLDFFHKLGYSTAQVQAVQQKFGADTDKVLGELVRIRAGRDADLGPVTTVSVPRGSPRAGGPELLLPVSDPSVQNQEDGGGPVLRAVVIDGSNVAMSHGNKEVFSCLGIQLAVNFFLDRGHSDVTVFVPSWRKEQPRPDVPITQQNILRELERKKVLVFTPSRRVAGRRVVCNDDCFIVKHALESDGVVVSNDQYRDLQGLNPEWKRFIDERLLMYSFVNNKFMLPDDPLGRHGPTLENFLRRFPKTQRKQTCPYGKKCTYGMKCRFHHPERVMQSQHSVTIDLRQNSDQKRALTHCNPGPELSLSLVEDIPKLTLGDENVSLKQEHLGQGRQEHRSGWRPQTRKKKASQQPDRGSVRDMRDSSSVRDRTSQEQLDSGLGSMDSQLIETVNSLCDQHYRPSYGSVQQQFCPPCSCCFPGPSRPPSTDPSPHSPSCPSCVFPISWPPFSQSADFQCSSRLRPQRRFWSDPFCICPLETRRQLGECSLWDPPPRPCRKDREDVRKKLLAIFSAQQVDAAMDMSPGQLDPQRLVAQILMLQSQNRSLR
ncbi:endoribonuclease ZC3H12A-like [Nematolebias whitei]|uniref:endoribonuclease ZC3H12A-like n=1 Tax=Nematolebias whitei TaxID=451745 RepID=UPI0018992A87|nr:endoribonuclease ZC3H12A-like [Nematolebias whitei]